LPKYSYTVAGTAVENQTWTVTGELVARPLSSFQRAPEKLLRDAFWKLTRGNAVLGLPGALQALDGVSWAQGGKVENAVGWVSRVRQNRRRRLLPPLGVAPYGSWMRSPVSVIAGPTPRGTPSRRAASHA
jgi:hypothetical protein